MTRQGLPLDVGSTMVVVVRTGELGHRGTGTHRHYRRSVRRSLDCTGLDCHRSLLSGKDGTRPLPLLTVGISFLTCGLVLSLGSTTTLVSGSLPDLTRGFCPLFFFRDLR